MISAAFLNWASDMIAVVVVEEEVGLVNVAWHSSDYHAPAFRCA